MLICFVISITYFLCLVTMCLLFVLYRGCLLVRQSFFSDDSRNLVDLTGGVSGCRGLHSSFRTTIGGLSLNMGMHFNTCNWILIQIANIDIIVFRLYRCFNHYGCNSWSSYWFSPHKSKCQRHQRYWLAQGPWNKITLPKILYYLSSGE